MTTAVSSNAPSGSSSEETRQRAIDIVRYLLDIARLRTRLVRDVDDYEHVLWCSSVPREPECAFLGWETEDEEGDGHWLRVQRAKEPKLTEPPSIVRRWIDTRKLTESSTDPKLLEEIAEPGDLEAPPKLLRLPDHPEVVSTWERYLSTAWRPWAKEHRRWQSVQTVYEELFAIYKDQQRLGEQYELLMAVGLLVWRVPTGHDVRRHLVVAKAALEFDADTGVFTVGPAPDGAAVTVELDMLDPTEQPLESKRIAEEVKGAAPADPWDRLTIDPVLRRLIGSIDPKGEYLQSQLEAGELDPQRPRATYAPALILRKRSSRGTALVLEQMLKSLEAGGEIPALFRQLAEEKKKASAGGGGGEFGAEAEWEESDVGRIFFPLPTNEEQRRIVQRFAKSDAVLVQGPPGTGKSHTIANLICHMLATGQRMLVTAQTPRALAVLHEKLPEPIQPLCISLLGEGAEEQRSLSRSVDQILAKLQTWNPKQNKEETALLEHRLDRTEQGKQRVEAEIRKIREGETETHQVADGRYCGTAARIAERLQHEREELGWIPDSVPMEAVMPIQPAALSASVRILAATDPQALEIARLQRPELEKLGLPARVEEAFEIERRLSAEAERSAKVADPAATARLAGLEASVLSTLRTQATALIQIAAQLNNSWAKQGLEELVAGRNATWKARLDSARPLIDGLTESAQAADGVTVEGLQGQSVETVTADAVALLTHLETGGKLGFWPLHPTPVKRALYLVKGVKVSGAPAASVATLKALLGRIDAIKRLDRLNALLNIDDRTGGELLALRAAEAHERWAILQQLVDFADRLGEYREAAHAAQAAPIGLANSLGSLHAETKALRAAHDRRRLQHAQSEIAGWSKLLAGLGNDRIHPSVGVALSAIEERNAASYRAAFTAIEDSGRLLASWQAACDGVALLEESAPALAAALRDDPANPLWTARLSKLAEAWSWARARTWTREHVKRLAGRDLEAQSHQLMEQIEDLTADLAASHAWRHFFSRLSDEHRQRLVAWKQAITRLGRGTGKMAGYYRREAQKHLAACRNAVPIWIMPLYRLYDTASAAPSMFDVIIVDEASQCGPEALPLLYMGAKVLIVGDDKQISPEAGFVNAESVLSLIGGHLKSLEHSDSFGIETSLFDHASRRFGPPVTLREHFRCMPEIIRFSNDMSYSPPGLIPLRQYPPERLQPVVARYVPDGKKDGSNSAVYNRAEAEAIVEAIIRCHDDTRYAEMTFGVITLQGNKQAKLIESMLLRRMSPEDIEDRRIICGEPYSFQGDERDIMFVSLVAAPNAGIGVLSKPADERRFNVAASRARDQMWLFHSVQPGDLSEKDLRRRLLEFALNPWSPSTTFGVDLDELEHLARSVNKSVVSPPSPFDSWFEVEVFLGVVRRGYRVIPQYELGGKRIDLMVEGAAARLAVECDGDHWHGAEAYQRDCDRQRKLERMGLRFFRVLESEFFADREQALRGLWSALDRMGIRSGGHDGPANRDIGIADCVTHHKVSAEVKPAEFLPVEDPMSELESEVASDEELTETPVLSTGGEMQLYQAWNGTTAPDPRSATPSELADALVDIVRAEGPVVCERAYRALLEKAGLKRIGRQLRSALNKSAAKALRSGKLVEAGSNGRGQMEMVVRLPTQPDIAVRTRGPRGWGEIPHAELRAVMQQFESATAAGDKSSLYRAVRRAYGYQNVGSDARRLLETL